MKLPACLPPTAKRRHVMRRGLLPYLEAENADRGPQGLLTVEMTQACSSYTRLCVMAVDSHLQQVTRNPGNTNYKSRTTPITCCKWSSVIVLVSHLSALFHVRPRLRAVLTNGIRPRKTKPIKLVATPRDFSQSEITRTKNIIISSY